MNIKGALFRKYKSIKYNISNKFGYIGLYYWTNQKNFGDLLGPAIFDHFSIPYIHAPIDLADAVSVGSILDKVPERFDGAILGSGFIQNGPSQSFPNAKIYGVRGLLTKTRINQSNINFIGDPGLLIDEIFDTSTKKMYDIGIIPHYSDKDEKEFKIFKKQTHTKYKTINIQSNPLSVYNQISKCRYILSSSLHGIVAAHSMGIPSAWARVSDNLKGGEFKFMDYFSIYNINPTPITPTNIKNESDIKSISWKPEKSLLNRKKNKIKESFINFKLEMM